MIHVLALMFQIIKKNMTVKVSILIAGVNEARFLVQHDLCEGNGDLIKMYAIQRKNQIIINVGVNKKN